MTPLPVSGDNFFFKFRKKKKKFVQNEKNKNKFELPKNIKLSPRNFCPNQNPQKLKIVIKEKLDNAHQHR